MDIIVESRSVWGKQRYYPISPDAKTLCSLHNKPTLTAHQLNICKKAGWNVSVKSQVVAIEDILV
jgi:hypothetical protein